MSERIAVEVVSRPVQTRVGEAKVIREISLEGELWGYVLEVTEPIQRFMLVDQNQDLFAINFSLKTRGQLDDIISYATDQLEKHGHKLTSSKSTSSNPRCYACNSTATTRCQSCGHEVSVAANACPQCGHPQRPVTAEPKCYLCSQSSTTTCGRCGKLICETHLRRPVVVGRYQSFRVCRPCDVRQKKEMKNGCMLCIFIAVGLAIACFIGNGWL